MSSLSTYSDERESVCPNCLNFDIRLFDKRVHKRAYLKGPSESYREAELKILPVEKFELTYQAGCKYCGLVCATRQLFSSKHPDSESCIKLINGYPPQIRYDIYTEKESFAIWATPGTTDWGALPILPSIPPDPASEESFGFVKEQLSHCASHHSQCQVTKVTTAPRRLLHVGSGTEPIHLVPAGAEARERYAALSYCWGGDQSLKLTKATESSLSRSISYENLPVLLQDAIVVCRRLGIPFLWIDALCIMQGEDGKDEWKHEAAHMADIYQNAFVTIYTASCSNPHQSFLRRDTWPTRALNVLARDKKFSPQVLARRNDPRGFHSLSVPIPSLDPLEKRAWAFQEYHLSRRIIAYTSNEIQWRCRQINACEPGCVDSSIVNFRRSHEHLQIHLTQLMQTLERKDIFELWHELVEHYTQSQLTFSGDKLVALSGLASLFSSRLDSVYVAGMWKDNLLRDLLWSSDETSNSDPSVRLHVPQAYRAPTFSWASLEGPIRYYRFGEIAQRLVSFDETCFITGEDTFGQRTETHLQLTGQLIPAKLKLLDNEHLVGSWWMGFRQDCPLAGGKVTCYLDTKLESVSIPLSSGQMLHTARRCTSGNDSNGLLDLCDVWCLRLARTLSEPSSYLLTDRMLILVISSGTSSHYERIGWAQYSVINDTPRDIRRARGDYERVYLAELDEYLPRLPMNTITII